MIVSVTGGMGEATITVRMDQYGVDNPGDFTFIVSIFNTSDISTVPESIRMITINSIDNVQVDIVVNNLREGMFYFTVASTNAFGNQLYNNTSVLSQSVIIQPILVIGEWDIMCRTLLYN